MPCFDILWSVILAVARLNCIHEYSLRLILIFSAFGVFRCACLTFAVLSYADTSTDLTFSYAGTHFLRDNPGGSCQKSPACHSG